MGAPVRKRYEALYDIGSNRVGRGVKRGITNKENAVAKLRVHAFSISADGFGAGPQQGIEHPLGVGGMQLHEWQFGTRTFQRLHGHAEAGSTGVDDDFFARGVENVGAWIVGRNMFGPIRGPWPDHSWNGWWGDEPPFGTPVFVLTHHARPPVTMEGGTTFHFITEGEHVALERATKAAGGSDVRLGGGVATLRQYLQAGLVDELHIAVVPSFLGTGEHLFGGLDLPALGYERTEYAGGEKAAHIVLTK